MTPYPLLTIVTLALSGAAYLLASSALRRRALEAEPKYRTKLATLIAALDQIDSTLLAEVLDGEGPVLDAVRAWQLRKRQIGVMTTLGIAPHNWGRSALEARATRERDEELAAERSRIRTAWVAAQGSILIVATVVGILLYTSSAKDNSSLSSSAVASEVRR